VANPTAGQAAINSFFNHLASLERQKNKSAKLKEDQARVAADIRAVAMDTNQNERRIRARFVSKAVRTVIDTIAQDSQYRSTPAAHARKDRYRELSSFFKKAHQKAYRSNMVPGKSSSSRHRRSSAKPTKNQRRRCREA
jgi:hypothetical protein